MPEFTIDLHGEPYFSDDLYSVLIGCASLGTGIDRVIVHEASGNILSGSHHPSAPPALSNATFEYADTVAAEQVHSCVYRVLLGFRNDHYYKAFRKRNGTQETSGVALFKKDGSFPGRWNGSAIADEFAQDAHANLADALEDAFGGSFPMRPAVPSLLIYSEAIRGIQQNGYWSTDVA